MKLGRCGDVWFLRYEEGFRFLLFGFIVVFRVGDGVFGLLMLVDVVILLGIVSRWFLYL